MTQLHMNPQWSMWNHHPQMINQVIPRLFIGDDRVAFNKPVLDKHQITHILNVATDVPNQFHEDITYMKIVLFDVETQNIIQYFGSTFEFIEKALRENDRNRVLVHCNAGISRSASLIIAYLLQKRIFVYFDDAYSHLKKVRPIIEPNNGFRKQLREFEGRLLIMDEKKKSSSCCGCSIL